MKTRLAAAAMILLAGTPALAHRLDEYLQGTLISVEKNRLQAQITLTPGVAVFQVLLAEIDTDADGVISETEQRAYAARVLRDLSLTIDGHPLTPRLISRQFPTIQEMQAGRGEIQIEFSADLPLGGANRRLIFENHHFRQIAAYQVNCLVPRDPDIRMPLRIGITRNRSINWSTCRLASSRTHRFRHGAQAIACGWARSRFCCARGSPCS